jgi:poly(A) polymerase
MNEARVSEELFGELLDAEAVARIAAIDDANDLDTRLAAETGCGVCHAGGWLADALRLSNAQGRAVAQLREAMPPSPALRDNERKVVLYQTGAETFARTVRLAWAESDATPDDKDWRGLLDLATDWAIPDLPVSGADLIAAGMEPGPALGAELARLEDWWVASGFMATKEELLARVSA